MRIALDKVVRTIDKSQDLSKQQQIISSSIRPLTSSLTTVCSRAKSWPLQKTGAESTDNLTIDSNLADYAIPFTKFGEGLTPRTSSELYGKLLALREQIATSEGRFATLKKTKRKVGAVAILQEGRRFQQLLATQRQLEHDLGLTVVSEWTGAISLFISNLKVVDKIPTIS